MTEEEAMALRAEDFYYSVQNIPGDGADNYMVNRYQVGSTRFLENNYLIKRPDWLCTRFLTMEEAQAYVAIKKITTRLQE